MYLKSLIKNKEHLYQLNVLSVGWPKEYLFYSPYHFQSKKWKIKKQCKQNELVELSFYQLVVKKIMWALILLTASFGSINISLMKGNWSPGLSCFGLQWDFEEDGWVLYVNAAPPLLDVVTSPPSHSLVPAEYSPYHHTYSMCISTVHYCCYRSVMRSVSYKLTELNRLTCLTCSGRFILILKGHCKYIMMEGWKKRREKRMKEKERKGGWILPSALMSTFLPSLFYFPPSFF